MHRLADSRTLSICVAVGTLCLLVPAQSIAAPPPASDEYTLDFSDGGGGGGQTTRTGAPERPARLKKAADQGGVAGETGPTEDPLATALSALAEVPPALELSWAALGLLGLASLRPRGSAT